LQVSEKETDAKKRICEAEEKKHNIQRDDEANALRLSEGFGSSVTFA
jgi:vacuolar-type H+-ATPase subunit H